VVPAIGVYAGYANVAGGPARHPAAISVGRNPTFGDDRAVSVEAYLMEFDGDLYGRPLALEFHAYLRHELRFESVEELVGQMWADIAEARSLLS
jgi:riboflavin kinase/FMN adenylyltransferase